MQTAETMQTAGTYTLSAEMNPPAEGVCSCCLHGFCCCSVHVLDLTNGKTVYMFVDKFYPIRATLLERMLRHRLTVPPSYCRDVVVAGNIIQTVQAGLRQAYECIASAPIACTARQMVFSSPWLTAKKESGSPLQTALVCTSNPLMVARLPKTGWYSFSMFLLG
ncbi:hypothetical protein Tco_1489799 [Tanacetum coccineum]